MTDLKKKIGNMLEPAWLYADIGENWASSIDTLSELEETVYEYNCRGAVVHPYDVSRIANCKCEKIISVLNGFPYGRGGVAIIKAELDSLFGFYKRIVGGDIVMDLYAFQDRNWSILAHHFGMVREALPGKEIKVICQMPFIWQYHKNKIFSFLELLVECEVNVVKDWTTIDNFSRPIKTDIKTRVEYTEYLRNLIDKHKMPLLIKIAGGVNKDNVVVFKKAGADIFGVSMHKVPSVIKALEGYLKKADRGIKGHRKAIARILDKMVGDKEKVLKVLGKILRKPAISVVLGEN